MRPPKAGSSPLARGGPVGTGRVRTASGLIPARAGRTCSASCGSSRSGAHPRSRGADGAAEEDTPPDEGSSPLARGGRRLRCGILDERRLIPARAGRTRRAARTAAPTTAHPRSRGADLVEHLSEGVDGGSSPLALGGLVAAGLEGGRDRLIPARAGRTEQLRDRLARNGAHPRSRGADQPPVSGTAPPRAHPRSRGADIMSSPTMGPRMGSSPLARGGRVVGLDTEVRLGLIPARAGRTGWDD